MALNVFISYATADIETVEKIRKSLAHPMAEVFVAEYSVEPGEDLMVRVVEAIRNADVFLLLWSKNSEVSDWVVREIELAQAQSKLILPLMLDGEAKWPERFGTLKYLRYDSDPEKAIEWLKAKVHTLVDQKNSKELLWIGAAVLAFFFLSR